MSEKADATSGGTGQTTDGDRDARAWVPPPLPSEPLMQPRNIILGAVFFLLLIMVVMVAVPALNATLLAGTVVDDRAEWYITTNVTMLGMLITGVFVITALRMEQSAKHAAGEVTVDFSPIPATQTFRPTHDADELAR